MPNKLIKRFFNFIYPTSDSHQFSTARKTQKYHLVVYGNNQPRFHYSTYLSSATSCLSCLRDELRQTYRHMQHKSMSNQQTASKEPEGSPAHPERLTNRPKYWRGTLCLNGTEWVSAIPARKFNHSGRNVSVGRHVIFKFLSQCAKLWISGIGQSARGPIRCSLFHSWWPINRYLWRPGESKLWWPGFSHGPLCVPGVMGSHTHQAQKSMV